MQQTARSTLLSLVEEHMTTVIRESTSVQRHAKRARLHPHNNSTDGLTGGVTTTPVAPWAQQGETATTSSSSLNHPTGMQIRRRLHAADINMALSLMGSEVLYSSPTAVVLPPSYHEGDDADNNAENDVQDETLLDKLTDDPNGSGGNSISQVEKSQTKTISIVKKASNKSVPLQEYLQALGDAMPEAPSEVGIRMQWIAVDGYQPNVPLSLQQKQPKLHQVASQSTSHSDDVATSSSVLRVNQLQASLLSEDLQLYFHRITLALERGVPRAGRGGGVLTVTMAQQQDNVLASLAQDAGLQELVPFLVRYCQQELYRHVVVLGQQSPSSSSQASIALRVAKASAMEHCRTLVRMAVSLLQNPHLHLELHLHELLPALMTCVVVSKKGSQSSTQTRAGADVTMTEASNAGRRSHVVPHLTNHWALRREAARALWLACNSFGEDYATLKARVLTALLRTLTPNDCNWASRYGGIVAISVFGARAIDSFLLPTILSDWSRWEVEEAEGPTNEDPEEALEIIMCQQASLNALSIFLRHATEAAAEPSTRTDWYALHECLGDRMTMLHSDPVDYALCFV